MNTTAKKLHKMKTKRAILLILLSGLQITVLLYLANIEINWVVVQHKQDSEHKNIHKLTF